MDSQRFAAPPSPAPSAPIAIAFGFVLLTLSACSQASAQGPLRRLGERIRENAQQRVPPAPPPAPPAVPDPRSTSPRPPAGQGAGNPDVAAEPNPAVRGTGTAADRIPNYNSPQPRRNSPYSGSGATRALDAGPSILAQASSTETSVVQSNPANRARLGVVVETPRPQQTPGRAPRPVRGVVVVRTEPGSSAESSGLLAGDLIMAIDGRMVTNVSDFVSSLATRNPGDRVELKLVRDNKLSAVNAIMAGPSGRLETDRIPANVTVDNRKGNNGGQTQPAATSTVPTSVEGLGRMLGGFFGNRSEKADGDGGDSPEPVLANENDEPMSPREVDPPSFGATIPNAEAEMLPPPVPAKSVMEEGLDFSEIETSNETRKPSLGPDQATIENLLQQIEELRQQVKQLEASAQPKL